MDKSKQRIFVDSNFFVALLSPNDTLHKKAIRISAKIKEEATELVISNFIFLEIVTILSQRVNRKASITFGTHLLQDEQVEIIHIDEQLQRRSWKIFQETDKKNISFVDCSIIATMEFFGIETLLTFDQKDFKPIRNMYRLAFFAV